MNVKCKTLFTIAGMTLLLFSCGGGGSDDPSPPPVNSLPSSSVSADTTSTEVQMDIQFTGSASDSDGTVDDFQWSFGDGNTGSGTSVSHSFETAGTYTVTLTVTDNSGGTDTSSVIITVEQAAVDNVAPEAQIAVDATNGLSPLTIQFDASASTDSDGTDESYSWDFGDPDSPTSEMGINVTHQFAGLGEFTVVLTITDDDGQQSTATQIIRADNPAALMSQVYTLLLKK